jgi:hypothetical protein
MLQGRFDDCFLDVYIMAGCHNHKALLLCSVEDGPHKARIVAFGGLMSRKDAVSIDHGLGARRRCGVSYCTIYSIDLPPIPL